MSGPKVAMVLAAGLGTRMRPLTDDRPKALVEVGGKALIDHMLDRLAEAGVERAVVNVHAHADRLIAHLSARTGAPAIDISDERDAPVPLETGGGIKRAAPLLGGAPIWVVNIDSVWIERSPTLRGLAHAWNPDLMDSLLLLTETDRALGFEGPGDFLIDEQGRLTPRKVTDAPSAPYAYTGVHITWPGAAAAHPEPAFSLFGLWVTQAEQGRLFGMILDGDWMHVGDPAARDAAEAKLASATLASASDA